jgi:hypothetical protein
VRLVAVALVLALSIGAAAAAVTHGSAPEEPWGRRLVRLVPLAVVAGCVLALWSDSA